MALIAEHPKGQMGFKSKIGKQMKLPFVFRKY